MKNNILHYRLMLILIFVNVIQSNFLHSQEIFIPPLLEGQNAPQNTNGIYNALGQLVKTVELFNPYEEISIGDLSTGIYIIKTKIEGVDYVNKIIKQ